VETKWLARIVGLVITAVAVGAAFLLAQIVILHPDLGVPTPIKEGLLGEWDLLYSSARPPASVFWAAVALALLAAAGIAIIERYAMRKARLSLNKRETPLSPILIMKETAGRHYPLTLTVLVPAHNEEAALPVTLPALMAQSYQPDRIIVLADNCTDSTIAVAEQHGAEVFVTVNNKRKKAGGLNQVLATFLPTARDNDIVMVMDADTSLDAGFIEAAMDRFRNDRALMSVGGIFYGENGHGLLGQFQRNEYIRYSRQINRRRGKVFVLTGTSSLFRPAALKAVAEARGHTIPGHEGDVYDTIALTEDNELTIALKSLGALMVSPPRCTVVTELMPDRKMLWTQRMRWQRGALDNIGAYGITLATARYWAQQMGIGYSVIALYSYMLMMLITVIAVDTWIWFPFWLLIGAVFIVERIVTVWRGGWKARLLALTLFPELGYDMYLNAIFVKSIWDITWDKKAHWGWEQTEQSVLASEATEGLAP